MGIPRVLRTNWSLSKDSPSHLPVFLVTWQGERVGVPLGPGGFSAHGRGTGQPTGEGGRRTKGRIGAGTLAGFLPACPAHSLARKKPQEESHTVAGLLPALGVARQGGPPLWMASCSFSCLACSLARILRPLRYSWSFCQAPGRAQGFSPGPSPPWPLLPTCPPGPAPPPHRDVEGLSLLLLAPPPASLSSPWVRAGGLEGLSGWTGLEGVEHISIF